MRQPLKQRRQRPNIPPTLRRHIRQVLIVHHLLVRQRLLQLLTRRQRLGQQRRRRVGGQRYTLVGLEIVIRVPYALHLLQQLAIVAVIRLHSISFAQRRVREAAKGGLAREGVRAESFFEFAQTGAHVELDELVFPGGHDVGLVGAVAPAKGRGAAWSAGHGAAAVDKGGLEEGVVGLELVAKPLELLFADSGDLANGVVVVAEAKGTGQTERGDTGAGSFGFFVPLGKEGFVEEAGGSLWHDAPLDFVEKLVVHEAEPGFVVEVDLVAVVVGQKPHAESAVLRCAGV